jgi:hypothetical protein
VQFNLKGCNCFVYGKELFKKFSVKLVIVAGICICEKLYIFICCCVSQKLVRQEFVFAKDLMREKS